MRRQKCRKCNKIKFADQFRFSKVTKNGLSTFCKDCIIDDLLKKEIKSET